MNAIETYYAGTLFRSRLEAKWAAFFDLLRWQWTYEPFDADHYLPDFVIAGQEPFVVEVKPVVAADDYCDALGKVAMGLENHWHHDILVVGVNAIAASLEGCCELHPAAGLLGRGRIFSDGYWGRCPVCSAVAISHPDQRWLGRPCGCQAIGTEIGGPIGDLINTMWATATNRVRWKPN